MKKNFNILAVVASITTLLTVCFTSCKSETDSNEFFGKQITSFIFTDSANDALSADITGTITESDHKISATVPNGTTVTALVATFAASAGSSVKVNGTAQVSGTTANDFTNNVTYTVTAEDGSTQTYTAAVTIEVASDTTAPADVTSLAATAEDAQVVLSWTNPTDTDFDHVAITWTTTADTTTNVGSGTTTGSTIATYTATELINGTDYTFTVCALDATGNKSNGVTVAKTPADVITYSAGDIMLSDGTKVNVADISSITAEQANKAIAVVVGTALSGKTLAMGLQKTTAIWATGTWGTDAVMSIEDPTQILTPAVPASGSDGFLTDITAIRSIPVNGLYGSVPFGAYTADSDLDGSDNWSQIKEAVNDEDNYETNYPAFYYAENYGTSLTEGYKTGWFIPAEADFNIIYANKATINASFAAINNAVAGKATVLATDFYSNYWTSSQDGSDWNSDMLIGGQSNQQAVWVSLTNDVQQNGGSKCETYIVRVVRVVQ